MDNLKTSSIGVTSIKFFGSILCLCIGTYILYDEALLFI